MNHSDKKNEMGRDVIASKIALTGFWRDKQVAFRVDVTEFGVRLLPNPALPFDQVFKKTVRLDFADPEVPGQPLLVVPVLEGTLKASDDKNVIIQGRLRCLTPHTGNDVEFVSFKIELLPNKTTSPAFVLFKTFTVGEASNTATISCDAAGLKGVKEISTLFPGQPTMVRYGGLLGLKEVAAQNLDWRWSFNFVLAADLLATAPRSGKIVPHATFLFELEAHMPMRADGQRYLPAGLEFEGNLWPKLVGSGGSANFAVFRQRLPVEGQWSETAGTIHWLVSVTLPQAPLLQLWNDRVVTPVKTALATVQAGRPFTALPFWRDQDGQSPRTWEAWLSFVDRSQKEDVGKVLPRVIEDAFPDNAVSMIPRLITADRARNVLYLEYPGTKTLKNASLETICAALPAPVDPEILQSSLEAEDRMYIGFRPKPLASSSTVTQLVRMGALDLKLPPARPVKLPQEDLNLEWSSFENLFRTIPKLSISDGKFQPGGIEFRHGEYQLPVVSTRPGSQDDPTAAGYLASDADSELQQDRSVTELLRPVRPLVIDLQSLLPNTGSTTIAYVLKLTENIEPDISQTITAELRILKGSAGATTEKISALIIDSQPLAVALVKADGSVQPEVTTALGNWSNKPGQSAWELSSGAQGFQLFLPPQGMGEAMHRRAEDDDIEPGKPIDFRFTPPALVSLRIGDNLQRFSEPLWNLRRVLNTTGFLAGAPIDQMRLELFYGVAAATNAQGLRLNEITARMGNNAAVLPKKVRWITAGDQALAYGAVSQTWAALLRVIRTRLAIYEVWRPARELADGTGQRKPLTLTDADGLQFTLRPSAQLKYPIRGESPRAVTDPNLPGFTPDGLAGGWSWGFESQNILEAVRATPKSKSAGLTGLYLSALGGWGQQKASFDQGRTTIHAKVEMGRASTINIERIGRIGVFWNKAKHVIVYERTVAASRQFFLEQHALTGNPVLRKVDEYVELIEEERAFPDKDAPPTTRGFVLGLRFTGGKPPRIRVNSKWGQDIGTLGWKIPLWVRGAFPEDIYPKPAIYALAAGASEDERTPIAIDEPDKLYFFTNTQSGVDADTDAWPAVEGVDFQTVRDKDLAAPSINGQVDPVQYKLQDLLIRPELGTFSFALEPAPAAANLVADRTGEIIRAIPRSITLMRGFRRTSTNPDPTVQTLSNLRGDLTNAFAPILQPDGLKTVQQQVQDYAAAVTALKENLKTIADVVTAKEKDLCAALANRVERQFDLFTAETNIQLVSALHQLHAEYRDGLAAIFSAGGSLDDTKNDLKVLLLLVVEGGNGARSRIQTVRGTIGEISARLDDARQALINANESLGELLDKAIAGIDSLDDLSTAANRKAALGILDNLQRAGARFMLPGPADFVVGEAVRSLVGDQIDAVRNQLNAKRLDLLVGPLKKLIVTLPTTKADLIDALQTMAQDAIDCFGAAVDTIDQTWLPMLEPLIETALEEPLEDLVARVNKTIDDLNAVDLKVYEKLLSDAGAVFFTNLDVQLGEVLPRARTLLRQNAEGLCLSLLPSAKDLLAGLTGLFDEHALDFALTDAAAARARIEEVLNRMGQALSSFVQRAQITLPAFNTELPSVSADSVIRLLRSFGDVPKVPNLAFNLPQIGYYFFSKGPEIPLPAIDLSPVAAFANRLKNDVLNAIHIQLPSKQLLDQLKPPDLSGFDLSKLFPNFAGLKLDFLFKTTKFPKLGESGIQVTHGINQETRSGWLQADVDLSLNDRTVVFQVAGAKLVLVQARFRATSRVEATATEPPRQRSRGSIQGDWQLEAGGRPVADLTGCTLRFDEGGQVHFDVNPSQVKLRPPLQFLSDLFAPFTSSKGGLTVAISATGARVSLVLPLPNIQAGTFGVAHVTLGFLFELIVVPEFLIRTAVQLSRADKPFTLTVFILGGAGSLQFAVTYVPRTGLFRTDLDIAIYASASLAISLGPISGGIYAYFGITISYTATSAGSSALSYGLRILFVGEVSLCGFITVNLCLGLEAEYRTGNQLIGRGFVSIEIKIGWFLTISIHASIEYAFGSGSTQTSSSTQIESAADEYVGMF